MGAAVNFVRVLSLMLNPEGEMAAVHTAQGILMTVVGVLVLAGVVPGCRRGKWPAISNRSFERAVHLRQQAPPTFYINLF